MPRLITVQTALSLGFVSGMLILVHLSSLCLLPTTTDRKTHLAFVWLAFVWLAFVWLAFVWLASFWLASFWLAFEWVVRGVREVARKKTVRKSGPSTRTLSAPAYMLLAAAVFSHTMPTVSASSTSSSSTTTLAPSPHHTTSILTSLKNLLTPFLLPLGLITFSFTVGAIQVVDKALRRVRRTNRSRRRKLLASLSIDEKTSPTRTILGFFHPYCNAGGGGERVLYEAISFHLATDPLCVAVVYTGDYPATSKDAILAKASARFGITLDAQRVALVGLTRRWMVEDATWTRFTLLGQSYGSVWLGFEALAQLVPDVWVDTMGYAFTYPVVRLLAWDLPVAAYVHYPVISTDMLARVEARQAGHTNDPRTANSRVRSWAKLVYYRLFARVYSWALRRADVVVGNGSWTTAHLEQLTRRKVEKVYPPCDTDQLAQFALAQHSRTVVSLAQFRPEKEHPTQLRVLKQLLETRPDLFAENGVKLIMMGSCRNADDEARIEKLRTLSTSLGLDKHVEFVVNANYDAICQQLAQASVGISTMKDEHFGINVVEFMAAGLVTLSHRSAGPWLDIAVPSANHPVPVKGGEEREEGTAVGYHAESVEEFADVLASIFDLQASEPEKVEKMRSAARRRAQSVFGRKAFTEAWQRKLWGKLEGKLQRSQQTKVHRQQQQQEKKEQ